MEREPRFPGIEWYCDHCGDCLSTQPGFNDHKYIWKCRKCGYKNSISWANIDSGTSAFGRTMLSFLGLLSGISLYTVIMLCIAIFGFHASKQVFMPLMLVFLGIYLILLVIAVIVENHFHHYKKTASMIAMIILRDLREDLVGPFATVKNGIAAIFGKFKRTGSTAEHIIWGALFFAVFVAEIVILSHIINYGFSDWFSLFGHWFSWLKEKIAGVIGNALMV